MAPEKREWTVPAPLRALMWWPGVAFVIVMIAPEVAAPAIAASGVALMGLGAVLPAAVRRIRRSAVAATATAAIADPPTIEIDLQTVEIPPVGRAA